MPDPDFELVYWPHIPGRGEFPRLLLEDAGADYTDVAREADDGFEAVTDLLRQRGGRDFAPPILRAGEVTVSQTANICDVLAEELDIGPDGRQARLHANQLQMTVEDYLTEIHDTHHPISVSEHYEEQAEAAARRAGFFVKERLPKYLGHFERALAAGEAGRSHFAVGDEHTYVDLSLFQILRGTRYAFPNAFERVAGDLSGLVALEERVAQRPGIEAYLESDRRLPFGEEGIFRQYSELDLGGE